MENPEMRGDFEPWKSLEETLMPILTKDIGGIFMPWLQANNQAVIDGHDSLSVMIKNKLFEHRIGSPNRYHKKSFLALCNEYKQLKIEPWLMLYCKNPHWLIIFQTKECNT